MKRNSFADSSIVSTPRTWVGVGEIWVVKSGLHDYDAIYIQAKVEDGDEERYYVHYVKDVKRSIELESHKVRGQRFLGVDGNSIYEPPQQKINDGSLVYFQSLLGKFDYASINISGNINKDSVIRDFSNGGVFDRSRVKFS